MPIRGHEKSVVNIPDGFCIGLTFTVGKKGSNKVGKWKSCHQEREIKRFGVTMAKPLWSHAQGIGRKKIGKNLNY
jgi:hypothetical protein